MDLIDLQQDATKKNKIVVGIDLGTTNSLIAMQESNGQIIIFSTENDQNFIPSIVYFENEKIYVGNSPKNSQNQQKISSIKRLMSGNPEHFKLFEQKNCCKIDQNSQTILINKQKFTPIEISALILKKLKNNAEKYLRHEIDEAVITIPAYFNETARNATKKAAQMAGLKVRRLINEPTAAALACKIDLNKNGIFLVFDLGGGTFDISMLRIAQGIIKVIAVDGSLQIGGDDFDEIVLQKLLQKMLLDPQNINAEEKIFLHNQARKIKEFFSENTIFEEEISFCNKKYKIHYTIEEFENNIADLIQKTIKITQKVLRQNPRETEKMDGIILVGGSTHLKLLQKELQKIHKHIITTPNPDEMVVRGAAMQAYNLGNKTGDLLIDVLPISLGIESLGGLMEKILQRNCPLPMRATQQFTTSVDNQNEIQFNIFQGELQNVTENFHIGGFVLSNIPSMPAYRPQIEVEFFVDVDGLLTVSACEKITDMQQKVEFNMLWNLQNQDIDKFLLAQLEKIDTDQKNSEEKELNLSLEKITNSLQKIKNTFDDKKQQEIQEIINRLNSADYVDQKKTVLQQANQLITQYIEEFLAKKIKV